MDDDKQRSKPSAPLARASLAHLMRWRVEPEAKWRSPGGRPHPEAEIWGPDTEATVAPGRTVHLPGNKRVGPGGRVTLPLSEVERLRELGFLE